MRPTHWLLVLIVILWTSTALPQEADSDPAPSPSPPAAKPFNPDDYNLSGDAMSVLVQKNNGDVWAIMSDLQKAQNNPRGFYNSLTPDQQKGIADRQPASPQH
jgi:hypothetical protein